MATKAEVVEAIMAEVGDRTTDAAIRAHYDGWFDDALDLVLSKWPWPYRRGIGEIAVVALDFETLNLPGTVSQIRALRDKDTRTPITYLDYDQLLAMAIDLTTTGSPRYWYLAGYDADANAQKVGLYPIPAEDATLQYDADLQVALPLGDDDVVPVPREVIGLLREAIRAYSLENEAQTELANAAWQRFFARLESLTASQGRSRKDKVRRLKADGDLAHVRTWRGDALTLGGGIPDPEA